MDVVKPRWTTSSFLLYLGAFVVWSAAVGAYGYLSSLYGKAAFAGWTALMLAVLLALGIGFRRRGTWLTAGLFAYLSVSAFGVFVGALFEWWGWGGGNSQTGPFDGWNWVEWLLILLVLAASSAALRAYRFPLFVLPIAVLWWFLVTDVVSGGGTWSAVVTLVIGLFYLVVASAVNRVYGFWLHVVAGGLVGGALLYWWHSTTTDWWLLAIAGVVFIRVGSVLRRSSWAVFGAAGMLAAATHFSIDWANTGIPFFGAEHSTRLWVPIVVGAVLGFLFVLLGLWAARRAE